MGDFSRARIPSGVIRQASCFLVGAKTTGHFFLQFQRDITSNMGMCTRFLKMLQKLKMAARGQPQKIFWAQKL